MKYTIKTHLYLVVCLSQIKHIANSLLVEFAVFFILCQGQAFGPRLLVQVPEHLLLQLILAIVDADGVIVPVQTVNQSLR